MSVNIGKKRREEILEFIKQYIAENQYPPSQKEIAEHFFITQSNAYQHMQRMRDIGMIDFKDKSSRTIRIMEEWL